MKQSLGLVSLVVRDYDEALQPKRSTGQFMQFDINDPQLAKTKVGIVEYVDIGSGPVVVSLHGAMGGYDQIFTRRVLVRAKVGEFMQRHFSA